jgi:response regulator RpfG family c-di-GMP phosphodiesterase
MTTSESSSNPPVKRLCLVIDDDLIITKSFKEILREVNLDILVASSVNEGRRILLKNPEIAIVICDYLLPDGSGVDFLRDLRVEYPTAVRILMTGVYDKDIAVQAVNAGQIFRFLVKPFSNDDVITSVVQGVDRFELLAENGRLQSKLALQNEELKHANELLERKVYQVQTRSDSLEKQNEEWHGVYRNLINLCLEILQRIDVDLFLHSQRVSRLAVALGRELKCDPLTLEKLEICGLLHDIGLLGCSHFLQANQRNLSAITEQHELDSVKSHADVSANLVKFLPYEDVVKAIAMHHEYLDGSGYSKGEKGENISQLARILSVADSYDETNTAPEFAYQAIEVNATRLYDAEIVRALARLVGSKDFILHKEKAVLLHELQPGMKLANSIYTTSGMLLVKQGQILNDAIIFKLQRHSNSNTISQNIYTEV